MSLFSKDTSRYKLLEAHAACVSRAAHTFQTLACDWEGIHGYVSQIEQIEHEADKIVQQTAQLIVSSQRFYNLGKKDLHALSSGLDDIVDYIAAAASRIALYRIAESREDFQKQCELLVKMTETTTKLIKSLRDTPRRSELAELYSEMHRLESQSDEIYRHALATLLNSPGNDPILVIKWKEIYDSVEQAADQCEDVANIVQSVLLKRS